MSRFSYKSLILILLFLLIPIVLFLRINQTGKEVSAEWFNDSWNYRQRVDITNSSGSDLIDFQVSIDIGTSALIAAGKMQSDCDDIRITDQNGNLLPYWIETGPNACNTTATTIWTKASSLPTSGATVYVYYGNPSASSVQNGNNVFEFFDDFSGTSIDAAKWTQGTIAATTGTNFSQSAGNLVGGNTNRYLQSLNPFTDNYIAETRINTITSSGNGFSTIGFWSSISNSFGILDHNGTSYYRNDAGWGGFAYNGSGQWNHDKVSVFGTSATYWRTGETSGALTGSVTNSGLSSEYLRLGTRYDSGSYNQNYSATWDWIFVRKAVATDPTATPQSEEIGGGPIAYWKFDEGIGTTAYNFAGSSINFNFGAGASAPAWAPEDQCISGKCLYFDGTSQELYGGTPEITNVDPGEVRTFSAWFKASVASSNQIIFWKEGNCIGYSSFVETDGDFTVYFRTGTGCTDYTTYSLVISDTDYNDNKWHFQTFIIDRPNEKLTIYIDGVKKGERAIDNTGQANNGSLKMGNLWNNTWPLKGFIDEAKIYIYARTADQIKADYASGLAGMSSSSDSSVNIGGASSGKSLSDGLVGYWKMDETSSPSLDSSGNNYSGSWVNTTTYANGKFGNSTSYNGTNDYINVPSNTTLNHTTNGTFSISIWVKPNTLSSSWRRGILRQESYLVSGYRFGFDNGGAPRFWTDQSGGTLTMLSSTPMTVNQWNHIIVTYNNQQAYLYLNGEKVGNGYGTYVAGANALYFGYIVSEYFSGQLDELRIYNRALSASEIRQLADYAPGPVAYWKFEEGVGTTAFDTSGNNNHGSWQGTLGSQWTIGKYGTAGNFNGTDTYLTKTDHDAIDIKTGSSTWSLWFKTNQSTRGIMYRKSDASNSNGVLIDIGVSVAGQIKCVVHFSPQITITSSTSTYNDNKWHHLACTLDRNDNTLKMYIDGKIGATTIDASTLSAINLNATADANIGQGGGGFFNGQIDEVKIYNYARTQKQILQDMAGDTSSSPRTGKPIAYWKFDEGVGTTTASWGIGGTALNGTITNATWTNTGKFGKSLNYDGSGDYTSVSNNAALNFGLNSFSVSFWMNFNPGTTQERWSLGKGYPYQSFGAGWAIANWTTGDPITPYLYVSDGTGAPTSHSLPFKSMNRGSWYQLTFVVNRDSNLVKTFMNGVYANQLDISSLGSFDNTDNFLLGTGNGTSNYSDAKIDEVKIYNYALTTDEVKQDYNQGSTFVFGTSNQTIGATTTSLDYCVPGDTSPCSPPIAEWKFEEGVGTTAYDTSGNNNHCFSINSPSWLNGKIGTSLQFNGSTQHLNCGSSSVLDPGAEITLEGWVKLNSSDGNWSSFISKSNKTSYFIMQRDGSTSLTFGAYFSGSGYKEVSIPTEKMSLNQWYYITATYSSSILKIYQNGILIGSNNTASGSIIDTTPSQLTLGASTTSSEYFSGYIDQVRVYNYARTPAQIAWSYNKGAPVGHWKMDECQGTQIADWSGNANHGTLSIGASGTQTSPGTCPATAGAWYNGKLGKFNASLNFDGSDDYITIPHSATLSPASITASGWIKFNSNSQWMLINKASGGVSGSYYIYSDNLSQSAWTIFGPTGTRYDCNMGALTTGTWYNMVGTFDATTGKMQCYLNGKLKNTTNNAALGSNSSNVYIGRYTSGYYTNAQIDDVRVYNYPLTPTQIKTLYNNGSVNFR